MGARANGKVCIVKNHSQQNANLAALTLPNHFRYATRHGYDMQIFVEPWATAKWGLLPWLQGLLERYEHLFCIGSDVVITRPEIPLSDFYDDSAGVVVSSERIRDSCPINNDTTIINANDKGRYVLNYLMSKEGAGDYQWLQQGILIELLLTHPGLVAVKPIQGIPRRESPERWTPQHFCIHFLSGNLQEKIARVRPFVRKRKVVWQRPKHRIEI